jgi:hypothetical protein
LTIEFFNGIFIQHVYSQQAHGKKTQPYTIPMFPIVNCQSSIVNMIYFPGEEKSGQHLMSLWRDYLEQYADREGDVEAQSIVGANHTVEVLVAFSRTLDRESRYKQLIDQRYSIFREALNQAEAFPDFLLNATFSIYNCVNTLSHQFTESNEPAAALIRKVDEQVHLSAESGVQIDMSASALRASFTLLGLMVITMDQDQRMTHAIRQVEQRFALAANAASSDWERLLNALYRMVEMIQILAFSTDPELGDRINQIALRFQEEDQEKGLPQKLRNGFCRFFEFAHIIVTHVDSMI